MKIVFFSNGSSHGKRILAKLIEMNILIDSIILECPSFDKSRIIKKIKNKFAKHILRFCPTVILSRLFVFFDNNFGNKKKMYTHFHKYSSSLHFTSNFNNSETSALLDSIKPDIIILGGSRILKETIIDKTKIGILNAHPGLLPYYRGVDVLAWSIYNNETPGVTIHFVDKGVDTGRICKQKKIQIEPTDTLNTLKTKAEQLSSDLMAEVVQAILKQGSYDTIENPRELGKQFYAMPLSMKQEVENKISTYKTI